jgi:transcriptional regulator with XRE-family HTH domain
MHEIQVLAEYTSGMVVLGNLRWYREQEALTQQELAKKAGVTRLTVMLLEQGKQQPRPATTRKLARALGVKPADLMTEDADGAA